MKPITDETILEIESNVVPEIGLCRPKKVKEFIEDLQKECAERLANEVGPEVGAVTVRLIVTFEMKEKK